MKTIEERAEYNNLLGKSENLAIYIVLYYALSDTKTLTIKEIISKIDKRFSGEITHNKANYILKTFVEKDIVRKNIKNGIHKYYLHKQIYIPSENTPIPQYQLVLITFGCVVMLFNFICMNNIIFKWTSLTFFGTVLLVIISHQFMFEYKN